MRGAWNGVKSSMEFKVGRYYRRTNLKSNIDIVKILNASVRNITFKIVRLKNRRNYDLEFKIGEVVTWSNYIEYFEDVCIRELWNGKHKI